MMGLAGLPSGRKPGPQAAPVVTVRVGEPERDPDYSSPATHTLPPPKSSNPRNPCRCACP